MLKSLLTEELSMNQAYLILQNNGNQAILYEAILLSQTIMQFVQFQRYPSELFLLFKSKI